MPTNSKTKIRLYGFFNNKALAEEVAKKHGAKVVKKRLKSGVRYLVQKAA